MRLILYTHDVKKQLDPRLHRDWDPGCSGAESCDGAGDSAPIWSRIPVDVDNNSNNHDSSAEDGRYALGRHLLQLHGADGSRSALETTSEEAAQRTAPHIPQFPEVAEDFL